MLRIWNLSVKWFIACRMMLRHHVCETVGLLTGDSPDCTEQYALDAVQEADALTEAALVDASAAFSDMYGHRIGPNHCYYPILRRSVAGYFGKLAERMTKGENIASVECAQELRSEGHHFVNAMPIAFTEGITMDHSYFREQGHGKKRKLDEMEGKLGVGEEAE